RRKQAVRPAASRSRCREEGRAEKGGDAPHDAAANRPQLEACASEQNRARFDVRTSHVGKAARMVTLTTPRSSANREAPSESKRTTRTVGWTRCPTALNPRRPRADVPPDRSG